MKSKPHKEAYQENPTLCIFCLIPLPYAKRKNKFCSSSCAAKLHNTTRSAATNEKRIKTLRNTINAKIRHQNCNRQKSLNDPLKIYYTKVTLNTCLVCCKTFYKKDKRKTCSKLCHRVLLSRAAKNKGMGGNKSNKAYGYYESPTAGKVWLESSYELKVAQQLDTYNVKWVRPSYFTYTLQEHTKRYYPDFYLIDYDVYLDPKNEYLIAKDRDKINAVVEQNNIKVFVLTKEQLEWTCI